MSILEKYSVKKLVLQGGICPFDEWFYSLTQQNQIIIDDRLARIRQGTFGEIRFIGESIWELKVSNGPGFRIYYAQIGKQVLLLIVGGEKKMQRRDILKAKELYRLFRLESRIL